MRKWMIMAGVSMLLAGCGQTGPTGPQGPQGQQGPAGPSGPGYSEVVLQPGPGDNKGKDTFFDQDTPVFGNSSTLGFGYAPSGDSKFRALMYFDLSQAGLPAGATIVDAILTLYPCSGGQDAGNLLTCHLYPLARDWSEMQATWNLAATGVNWTTPGGDFVSTAPLGGFTVDPVTAAKIEIHLDATYVQGWLNGQVNHGFIIKEDNESGANRNMGVYSREYTVDPAKRPALRLIYK